MRPAPLLVRLNKKKRQNIFITMNKFTVVNKFKIIIRVRFRLGQSFVRLGLALGLEDKDMLWVI